MAVDAELRPALALGQPAYVAPVGAHDVDGAAALSDSAAGEGEPESVGGGCGKGVVQHDVVGQLPEAPAFPVATVELAVAPVVEHRDQDAAVVCGQIRVAHPWPQEWPEHVASLPTVHEDERQEREPCGVSADERVLQEREASRPRPGHATAGSGLGQTRERPTLEVDQVDRRRSVEIADDREPRAVRRPGGGPPVGQAARDPALGGDQIDVVAVLREGGIGDRVAGG